MILFVVHEDVSLSPRLAFSRKIDTLVSLETSSIIYQEIPIMQYVPFLREPTFDGGGSQSSRAWTLST